MFLILNLFLILIVFLFRLRSFNKICRFDDFGPLAPKIVKITQSMWSVQEKNGHQERCRTNDRQFLDKYRGRHRAGRNVILSLHSPIMTRCFLCIVVAFILPLTGKYYWQLEVLQWGHTDSSLSPSCFSSPFCKVMQATRFGFQTSLTI